MIRSMSSGRKGNFDSRSLDKYTKYAATKSFTSGFNSGHKQMMSSARGKSARLMTIAEKPLSTLKKDRSMGALHSTRSKEAIAAALYTGRLNSAIYDADGRLVEVINEKERNRAR